MNKVITTTSLSKHSYTIHTISKFWIESLYCFQTPQFRSKDCVIACLIVCSKRHLDGDSGVDKLQEKQHGRNRLLKRFTFEIVQLEDYRNN